MSTDKKQSKYARKIRMKNGGGRRYAGWMWWTQAEGASEREVSTIKPQYGRRAADRHAGMVGAL